jgi:hypothetical protein
MERLSRTVLAHRRRVIALVLLLFVAGGAAIALLVPRLSERNEYPALASYQANQLIRDTVGTGGYQRPSVPVVTFPAGTTVDDPATLNALRSAFAAASAATSARAVSYADAPQPALRSADGGWRTGRGAGQRPLAPVARTRRRGGEDRHRPQQLLALPRHGTTSPTTPPHTPPVARPVARPINERTRARHAAVHKLLGQGVGLLDCARRLGWSLNTIKRYARAATADQLQRPPRYGRTLVDPYRDHLRRRLATEPQMAATTLLAEIRELGYTGSATLLVRYLNQGRADTERAVPAPRRLVSWIMTRPADLPDHDRVHLDELLATCPHPAALAEHVRAFAGLLADRRGADLESWMSAVDAGELAALHGFVRGLRKDLPAVTAGLSLPYSNGPAEGVNTKVKLLKRQMCGRAGFALLRKRILLS